MKAGVIFPSQSFDALNFWIVFTIFLVCFLWILYSRWVLHKNRKKESVWIAILFFMILGIDLENPVSFVIFTPLVFSSLLEFLRKNQKSAGTENEEVEGLESLIKENSLLKKRVLDTPKTFFSQANFFSNLITLNEIQLIQSVVESTVNFQSANQASLYKYEKTSNKFHLAARHHHSTGLQLESNSSIDDRILFLISEAKRTITIQEIYRNNKLYQLWQNSFSKAMLYSPIYNEDELIGILTIDDIEFFRLHRDTVRDMQVIAKLTGLLYRNILVHQSLLTNNKTSNSEDNTKYPNFLITINNEFKRANRNQLPLSIMLIAMEANSEEQAQLLPESSLLEQIKSSCLENLRDVDYLFDGDEAGQFWVILPFTNFDGLCYVMERINVIVKMDLADQTLFTCHFGFSSSHPGLQQPRQMVQACQDSLQLHKTVSELVHRKKIKAADVGV